jgi:hypothetical protein
MRRLAARLAKLEALRVSPEECDGMGNTHLVNDRDAFDPARVPRCRTCGGQHAIVIREVVVERGEDGQLVEVQRLPSSAHSLGRTHPRTYRPTIRGTGARNFVLGSRTAREPGGSKRSAGAGEVFTAPPGRPARHSEHDPCPRCTPPRPFPATRCPDFSNSRGCGLLARAGKNSRSHSPTFFVSATGLSKVGENCQSSFRVTTRPKWPRLRGAPFSTTK